MITVENLDLDLGLMEVSKNLLDLSMQNLVWRKTTNISTSFPCNIFWRMQLQTLGRIDTVR